MALTNARRREMSPEENLVRALTDAIGQFERDNFHRKIRRVRIDLVDDLILLRLQGVLSPAGTKLGRVS